MWDFSFGRSERSFKIKFKRKFKTLSSQITPSKASSKIWQISIAKQRFVISNSTAPTPTNKAYGRPEGGKLCDFKSLYCTVAPNGRYQYKGIEHLEELGLNVNFATFRTLDPSIGRWWQVDPEAENFVTLSPYNSMANNPVKNIDPAGDFLLWFTDVGYSLQKRYFPAAIKFNLNLLNGTGNYGFETSFGIPQFMPFSYRFHYGKSWYSSGSYNGISNKWETRKGREVSYFGVISFASMEYESSHYTGSSTGQTTGIVKLGSSFINAKYENDDQRQPKIGGKSLLNILTPGIESFGDKGDRFRSAALQFNIGLMKAGFNLGTGDVGPSGNRSDIEIDGQLYYDGEPRKHRVGIAYFGIGPLRFGGNSEGIRNQIQNKWVHTWTGDPFIPVVPERKPRFYWSFGTGYGTGLW